MRHVYLTWFFSWIFLATATWAEEPTSGTMEEYRATIQTIAKGVAKVLRSRNEDAITIGSFAGPANLGTAAGPGLKQLFTEELQGLKIRVARLGTPLGLSGEYRLTKRHPDAETKQVQLEVKLTDDSGQSVADLASLIEVPEWQKDVIHTDNTDQGKAVIDTLSSPEATALAMGLTVDFDAVHRRRYGPNNQDYNNDPIDIIKEASEKSTAHVLNGNELRASSTSQFGLQILVNGAPRKIELEFGRPFVSLTQGDTFKLKVNNRSNLSVATVITLDGINSFAFSEVRRDNGQSKYRQWILSPQQSFDLAGWHVNNSYAKEFKVTDFSQSAAALLNSDAPIGMIAVVMRATWKQNESPPHDEAAMPGAGFALGAAPNNAIGFGDEVRQKVNEDAQLREYGRVRSVLTIRYEKP